MRKVLEAVYSALLEERQLSVDYRKRGERRPKQAPNIEWAVRGRGRLGGWSDSKHTGRIGWSSMWRGGARLEERVVGWKRARDEM